MGSGLTPAPLHNHGPISDRSAMPSTVPALLDRCMRLPDPQSRPRPDDQQGPTDPRHPGPAWRQLLGQHQGRTPVSAVHARCGALHGRATPVLHRAARHAPSFRARRIGASVAPMLRDPVHCGRALRPRIPSRALGSCAALRLRRRSSLPESVHARTCRLDRCRDALAFGLRIARSIRQSRGPHQSHRASRTRRAGSPTGLARTSCRPTRRSASTGAEMGRAPASTGAQLQSRLHADLARFGRRHPCPARRLDLLRRLRSFGSSLDRSAARKSVARNGADQARIARITRSDPPCRIRHGLDCGT